jgi:hypothetical protein
MTLGKFTYGVELEWSDVDRRTELPEDCGTWDPKEMTILNSNGQAVDPTMKTTFYGGEINTVPTYTIREQGEITKRLKELLNPVSLYRANLHVHVGVEGLAESIDDLRNLFQYTLDNQDFVYHEMLPYARPTQEEWPDPVDFDLAKKFFRQQNYWAKQKVPPTRVPNVLAATTPKEFYDAHFHWNEEQQRRQYSIAIVRAGINIRSLFKHNSVEFRLFPGTTDPKQVVDCLEFADAYMRAGLWDHSITARDIYESKEWNFPEWQPFLPELEKVFLSTKQSHMEYPDPNISYQRKKEQKRLEQERMNNDIQ